MIGCRHLITFSPARPVPGGHGRHDRRLWEKTAAFPPHPASQARHLLLKEKAARSDRSGREKAWHRSSGRGNGITVARDATKNRPYGSPCGRLQRVKKVSQSLPPAGGKKSEIIFSRDMCVRENTAQAASVEFVRHRHTNSARSRLQPLCRKTLRVFRQSETARTGLRAGGCAVCAAIMRKRRGRRSWPCRSGGC